MLCVWCMSVVFTFSRSSFDICDVSLSLSLSVCVCVCVCGVGVRVLRRVFPTISMGQVVHLFERIDQNRKGYIDYGITPPPHFFFAVKLTGASLDEFMVFVQQNPEYMQLIDLQIAQRQQEELRQGKEEETEKEENEEEEEEEEAQQQQ